MKKTIKQNFLVRAAVTLALAMAIGTQTATADAAVAATFTPDPAHFEQDGDTYTIKTATGWGVFCDLIDEGTTFSGKTVTLADDITVSRIAGSGAGADLTASDRPFCGTFLGGGKTLTFNYGSNGTPTDENNVAPFRYVNNATISGLHVAGDIYTKHVHSGGIVGMAYGTTNITDCRSSVNIHSSINGDGTHGGIMSCSWTGSTTNITGCLFDGSIQSAEGYATDQCGGIVGRTSASFGTVENSIYLGTTVEGTAYVGAVAGSSSGTVENCYYTDAAFTGLDRSGAATDPAASAVGHGGTVTNVGPAMRDDADNTAFIGLMADRNTALEAVARTPVLSAAVTVTLAGRTLYKDGTWNTLCLPFAMTAGQVTAQLAPTKLMELDTDGTYNDHQTGLDKDGTLYLNFKDATEIKAGRPYIVKWDGTEGTELVSPVFSGVTIDAAASTAVTSSDGWVTYVGSYAPVALPAADQTSLLIGSGNTLQQPADGTRLNAFRAYLSIPSPIDLDSLTDAVLGKAEPTAASDLNGDQQTDILDIAALINILARGNVITTVVSNVDLDFSD